jgi:predicted nucleotidyltransferase
VAAVSAQNLDRARIAAELLAADPRTRLVFLFGSAADPRRPAPRDLDLAILTEPSLSLTERLDLRADLVARVGGAIDLVPLNQAPVVLAYEVARTGVCLYATDPDIATEFICRALREFWDWQPFLEVQWRYAGERLEARQRGAAT